MGEPWKKVKGTMTCEMRPQIRSWGSSTSDGLALRAVKTPLRVWSREEWGCSDSVRPAFRKIAVSGGASEQMCVGESGGPCVQGCMRNGEQSLGMKVQSENGEG